MKLRIAPALANRLPVIGFGIGMSIIAVLSSASFFSISNLSTNTAWVEHTHRVRFDLEQTAFAASDAQAAVRGYLISNKTDFLTPYNEAATKLPKLLTGLSTLVSDNQTQQLKMAQLSSSINGFMDVMQHAVQLRQSAAEPSQANAFVTEGAGDRALAQIRLQISALQDTEAALLIQRKQQAEVSSRNTRLLLITGTCIAFLLFGGTFLLLWREIRQGERADAALSTSNSILVKHASQLEQANQELESFSYSISHDLRIPLRAVSGYASMLAEDYEDLLDNEGKRLLNVIRNNSKQMGILIDDLLAFSKLGRQALVATEIDMRALAENVLDELHDREPRHPAAVTIGELPVGWGDRALLRQVWINLISNALKYSSKNLTAEVQIAGVDNDTESIYSIRDNGVGFDMTYYDKLFGVFQRLHSTEEFAGTGVGLAIVHRVITRHGGRVWAESEIGKGSTFFFALPHKELA